MSVSPNLLKTPNDMLGRDLPRIIHNQARLPNLVQLCLVASAGSIVLTGRFINVDHQVLYDSRQGANFGKSRFSITITNTPRTFYQLLTADGFAIPQSAAAIKFNISGAGDLIWNCAAMLNGLINANHTDWMPSALYDEVIPANTTAAIIGRASRNP